MLFVYNIYLHRHSIGIDTFNRDNIMKLIKDLWSLFILLMPLWIVIGFSLAIHIIYTGVTVWVAKLIW